MLHWYSLTRRFTLLRTSTGDPVSLEDLRSRFAEQRARGAPNQITEEEEDMILETLGRLRAKNAVISDAEASRPLMNTETSPDRHSRSSNTTSSTIYPVSSVSSSSSRYAKRYSNNLFGSGRFRDNYIRSLSSQRSTSNRSFSIAPTDSSHSLKEKDSSYSDSLRRGTPDGSAAPSSIPSSPNEKTPIGRSASLTSTSDESAPGADRSLAYALNPISIQRASLALEGVIRELEEEAEDEIVMPRTAHVMPRVTDASQILGVPESDHSTDQGTLVRECCRLAELSQELRCFNRVLMI